MTTFQATYQGPSEFYTGLRPGTLVTVERVDRGYAVTYAAYRVVDGKRQVTLSVHDPDRLIPVTDLDAIRKAGLEPEPGASAAELAALAADLPKES